MLMPATKPQTMVKREMEVESILRWCFREELPKRQLSAQEARWRGMEVSGHFGPVDEGTPVQRYAYVGDPHRDAVAIEKAVSELPMVEIDWVESLEAIMGELAGLLTVNDIQGDREAAARVTKSSWTERKNKLDKYLRVPNRAKSINVPRDVLMVGSVNSGALVQSHACQGTRPRWVSSGPTCHATPPRGPGDAMIIGECRGRNLYSTGTYCPLTWRPSPIMIAQARADYIGWWRGLAILAESLELDDHTVLPPAAPRLPWHDAEPAVSLFGQRSPPKMARLLLKPERTLAGPTRGQGEDVARRYPGRSINLDGSLLT